MMKLIAGILISLWTLSVSAQTIKIQLEGAQEVPAVSTQASGMGEFNIDKDGAISGSVITKNIKGTMAHVHLAAKGKNGPVIIKLTKTDENTWSIPAGASLTKEQVESFKKGELYANVHSANHKSGEIRGQLLPQ
jgi:hypothetical protein